MAQLPAIKAKIRDSEKVIFEGQVDRISSFNEFGPFDIYPMHANFISIIRQHLTLYNKREKVQDLQIEQAVLKIKKDEIHIFLGIETLVLDDSPKTPEKAKKA